MKCAPEHAAHLARICQQRIGMDGYCKIIGSLRYRKAPAAELARRFGVSHNSVLMLMRHCLRAGVVRRDSWMRPAPHSRMVPVWALSPGPDVGMPLYEERTRRPRRAPSTLILLTTTLELLREHALSRTELASELCMSTDSITRLTQRLRAHRLIYIESWHKPPIGAPSPEFRAGIKADAPRPPRQSSAWQAAVFSGRRRHVEMVRATAGRGSAA